jgi:transmembrane sensor
VPAEPLRRLPDGSIVELNTGAEIIVRFEAAVRRVDLVRGEALFRVEKDAARPFVVGAGGIDVRAIGTAFSVRLDGAAVEVLVTEGRVGVNDAADGGSLLPAGPAEAVPVLVAGQSVKVATPVPAAGAVRQVEVTQISPSAQKAWLAWRIPRLEFDGVELASAVTQLNRSNRLQISLERAALGRLRLSGSFSPDDPRTFARLVAGSLGLEIEERADGSLLLRQPAPKP